MLRIFKRNKETVQIDKMDENKAQDRAPLDQSETPAIEKVSIFNRLKLGLTRTRQNLGEGISSLFLGKKEIDADLLEEIETRLLLADLGIATTQSIIEDLTAQVSRKQIQDPQVLSESLKNLLQNILSPVAKPLVITDKKPFVILMVGINGSGKTTTIGKLTKQLQTQGKKVMLAAGDTFRAAAIEQLQVWGERNQVPVVAQLAGADSAAVIYDAYLSAKARDFDVLIADTAGRLHTQSHLMEELKKIKRVLQKIDPELPHEIMIILDAGIGQNALNQAKEFHQAMGLTGITVTKLDGTAKGGILFAIANELKLPIRFIGIGEGIEDLRDFNAQDFVQALFSTT